MRLKSVQATKWCPDAKSLDRFTTFWAVVVNRIGIAGNIPHPNCLCITDKCAAWIQLGTSNDYGYCHRNDGYEHKTD